MTYDAVIIGTGPARLARSALFVHAQVRQRSDLPTQLGCRILDDGAVEIKDLGQSSVPGVYAAGDMARRPAVPLSGAQVILAAAEGSLRPSSSTRNSCSPQPQPTDPPPKRNGDQTHD